MLQSQIIRMMPGLGEIDRIIELLLLQEWEDQHTPTVQRLPRFVRRVGRGQVSVMTLVIQNRNADHLEMIQALSPSRCCLGATESGEHQETNQQGQGNSRTPITLLSEQHSDGKYPRREQGPHTPRKHRCETNPQDQRTRDE